MQTLQAEHLQPCVLHFLRRLTQDASSAGEDLRFMMGVTKAPAFDVHLLAFSPLQVWAEITLINPDAVTSPLGTAAAPQSPPF